MLWWEGNDHGFTFPNAGDCRKGQKKARWWPELHEQKTFFFSCAGKLTAHTTHHEHPFSPTFIGNRSIVEDNNELFGKECTLNSFSPQMHVKLILSLGRFLNTNSFV